MDRDSELAIVRRAYARQIMAAAGIADLRVEAAFAAVPREAYLGPGPWPILRWERGYVTTPSRNPVYLYADVLVGIVPERNLNNGQPSFLAALIASGGPRPGEHAVHIGAGVGYYTAIIARLVGRAGRVTAIEFDPVLAGRLAANFAGSHQVRVVKGDGAQAEFDAADMIFVNAGATRPADPWLGRLAEGGRLILPLTTDRGAHGSEAMPIQRRGAAFCIERRGGEFFSKWISPVAIFPCEGARDAESEAALAGAFAKEGDWLRVTRLYRRGDLAEADCWLRAPGWCLAYR